MCIFCKIVKGEIPNQTILEDEIFLAFNDINPTRKIHVLIIPKKHYESRFFFRKIILLNKKYLTSCYLTNLPAGSPPIK